MSKQNTALGLQNLTLLYKGCLCAAVRASEDMRIDVELDQLARGVLVLRRRQEAALDQVAAQQQ